MAEIETIKAAKKQHRCSWCDKRIEVGESYKRYRWFGDDGPSTVKLHHECYDAMHEAAQEEGGDFEFMPGENPRGCNCGFSAGCERCAARKAEHG